MDLKNKKVLVTGAGGFVGSHLTEKLVSSGAKVSALVRYNSQNNYGLLEILPNRIKSKLNIITGNLKNSESVDRAVKNVEIIFHLGALISIPYSYQEPSEVTETNVLGTLNILNAARKNNGIQKIIHTSTSEVYGSAKYIPMDEKHPLCAQSPYAASKIAADKIAESFYLSYGLPVATVRPFNIYGPRQSTRAIVPTIISQALTSKKVYLGLLKPTRDLTYVDDTVEGFIKVAESDDSIGETINIGSGFEISIEDLASKIFSILGTKARIISDNERIRPKSSEVVKLLADNSKAKEILGWKPKVSLDEGLKKTIDWLKNNLELYKSNVYNL